MTIGIIGAGNIGRALAKKLAVAGYQVEICNSRGPGSLASFVRETGENITAVTAEKAADNEVVILAVRWVNVEEVLKRTAYAMVGKILIDTTNPILNDGSYAELFGLGSSEIVSFLIPGAFLVKAFNALRAEWIDDEPLFFGGRRVVFYSGDDARAKVTVNRIIRQIGFSPVDIGDLETGNNLQQAGKPLALKNLISLN